MVKMVELYEKSVINEKSLKKLPTWTKTISYCLLKQLVHYTDLKWCKNCKRCYANILTKKTGIYRKTRK